MSEHHCEDAMYHDEWANETCPTCGEAVNEHGNTESDPIVFCQFPDCGCIRVGCPMGGIVR